MVSLLVGLKLKDSNLPCALLKDGKECSQSTPCHVTQIPVVCCEDKSSCLGKQGWFFLRYLNISSRVIFLSKTRWIGLGYATIAAQSPVNSKYYLRGLKDLRPFNYMDFMENIFIGQVINASKRWFFPMMFLLDTEKYWGLKFIKTHFSCT